jgi:hypothetical protein
MKKIILALICASSMTQAATLVVTGACSEKPLLKKSIKINEMTAGKFTMAMFDKYKVPFEGSDQHVSSIYNSPKGLDAMEVLSDTKMRSHGWCFAINGELAEVYPHEISIKDTDTVHWFYGYANYDAGEWSGMCQPTFEIAPAQFCD